MAQDETLQNQLAGIIPVGTTDTTEQLNLRDKIDQQKEKLEEINQSRPSTNKREISVVVSQLKEIGLVRYGVTPIQNEYLFENAKINDSEKLALVFSVPMRYEKMKTVPSIESATEIFRAYAEVGDLVIKATYIFKKMGYQATGHHPLGNKLEYHSILFPPHAVLGGLGERGRTGLFIDHLFGPLVRLGLITISAPLITTKEVQKGIEEFCKRCLYCVTRCPPRAITKTSFQDYIKLGVNIEFKIDGKKCIKYFEKHHGCGKCLFHCVLAKPNLSETRKRIERIEAWYTKWITSGLYDELHEQYL